MENAHLFALKNNYFITTSNSQTGKKLTVMYGGARVINLLVALSIAIIKFVSRQLQYFLNTFFLLSCP